MLLDTSGLYNYLDSSEPYYQGAQRLLETLGRKVTHSYIGRCCVRRQAFPLHRTTRRSHCVRKYRLLSLKIFRFGEVAYSSKSSKPTGGTE